LKPTGLPKPELDNEVCSPSGEVLTVVDLPRFRRYVVLFFAAGVSGVGASLRAEGSHLKGVSASFLFNVDAVEITGLRIDPIDGAVKRDGARILTFN